ncbi:class I SAM-dependent methyltransferase [Rhodobacteraceae bacterium 2376]|uniref:Class I SAM-dependent methyltransferase n=1 Tax=Rhabdonatronobacter sediminivivens TaxID=2743469 RepID=A0A7Z0HY66_9RHOB|nr:class I SAM-dependent methyltransferase [Rhabdonatronobacter sediminivivens]NYS24448.1 class I SAM-dependent methyltransferase [Rhabdonatronobacter sediminivivens]
MVARNLSLSFLKVRIPRLRWALRKLFQGNPPKGDIYYGDMAALYDAERAGSKRWQREQAAVEAYLERLPRELCVLDVPVGTGRYLPLYKDRGHQATGFDASHEMLGETRKRAEELGLAVTLDHGDATQLPYADGQFDLVVSTRFLRHVLPFGLAKQSLAEMARVTREHAIIEMGISTRPTVWPAEGKPMRDSLHLDDLVAMFNTAGFEVLDDTTTNKQGRRAQREGRRRAVFLLRKRA